MDIKRRVINNFGIVFLNIQGNGSSECDLKTSLNKSIVNKMVLLVRYIGNILSTLWSVDVVFVSSRFPLFCPGAVCDADRRDVTIQGRPSLNLKNKSTLKW